jgi:hypothetical protein
MSPDNCETNLANRRRKRHHAAGFRNRSSAMTVVRKRKDAVNDDHMFDDAEALIALAQRSFTRAAKAEVAENDRLGIPTHGSVNGKLVVRHPPKAAHQH